MRRLIATENTEIKEFVFKNLAFVDPQTSGGLLISLPQKGLKKFDLTMKKEKAPYWVIGEVVKGSGRIVVER